MCLCTTSSNHQDDNNDDHACNGDPDNKDEEVVGEDSCGGEVLAGVVGDGETYVVVAGDAFVVVGDVVVGDDPGGLTVGDAPADLGEGVVGDVDVGDGVEFDAVGTVVNGVVADV